MGKKAKEHRKKVARRNEQIKNSQRAFKNAWIAAQIANGRYEPVPGHFTELTASEQTQPE